MFTRAIVRPPTENFADGETSNILGPPDFAIALSQHEKYCTALEKCGLEVIRLKPEKEHPDATFVEDTAIVTRNGAIVTRPGAVSRRGETASIAKALSPFYEQLHFIREEESSVEAAPTVDGGDVCKIGDHFFIGISERTNQSGATQLSRMLDDLGYTSTHVDIRGVDGLLHLKSGIAYLGDGQLALVEAIADRSEFAEYDPVLVKPDEEYAANCVRINDYVLTAAGFSDFERQLIERGYKTLSLEMSEFRKMDGGLSCLSLRF